MVIERKERLKRYRVWNRIAKMSPEHLEDGLRELGDADASVSESADAIWRILGTPATPKQMRQRMSLEERQVLDDLKSRRDANAAQGIINAPPLTGGSITPTPPVPNVSVGEFWVYEDDPTNRARVHKSTCGYCKPGDPRLPNNRWHGPYSTREVAFATMQNLGKRDTGGCGACRP